jgi:hypothetical protein
MLGGEPGERPRGEGGVGVDTSGPRIRAPMLWRSRSSQNGIALQPDDASGQRWCTGVAASLGNTEDKIDRHRVSRRAGGNHGDYYRHGNGHHIINLNNWLW